MRALLNWLQDTFLIRPSRWYLHRAGFRTLTLADIDLTLAVVDTCERRMRRVQGGSRARFGHPDQTAPVSDAEKASRRVLRIFRRHLLTLRQAQ